MTDTPRRYAVEDLVLLHPPVDRCDYGYIVGTVTHEGYREDIAYWGDEAAEGTGPLYLVNVGNVFSGRCEEVFAESQLSPHPDDHPDGAWRSRPRAEDRPQLSVLPGGRP